jgi:3-hydroxybutyryl-CoA dehydrogenase
MKNISVIGAGQMGNGIVQVLSVNGFSVTMIDINQIAVDKGLANIVKNFDRMVAKGTLTQDLVNEGLANIKCEIDLPKGVQAADLVIEAATENVNLKLKIFADLDLYAPTECILASNTSSISITKIAAATKRPEKVIGMHFMNPVPIMKLVEVINGYSTSKEVSESILTLSNKIGKTPTLVNDYPGFVANRILMPMINESIETLFQGIGGVAEIDTIMKLGMAHPMGPLQLADFIGLDTCLAILGVLYDGFGQAKYAPCPLLVNMVAAGKLGIKTGEGFYKYTPGSKELVVSQSFK